MLGLQLLSSDVIRFLLRAFNRDTEPFFFLFICYQFLLALSYYYCCELI